MSKKDLSKRDSSKKDKKSAKSKKDAKSKVVAKPGAVDGAGAGADCSPAARKRLEDRRPERQTKEAQLERIAVGKSVDWRAVDGLDRLYERARRLGMVQEAADLLEDPDANGAKVLEKIIATNELLDVRFLQVGAQAARCIGRLSRPVAGGLKVGTGFLVSPRVMMTNHHVISSREEALEMTWELDFFVREDHMATGPTQAFRLQPDGLFLADEDLDFALVAVEPVNDAGQSLADRGFHTLIPQSGKAIVGERLNIIQHPGGDPQKVALHDNKLIDVVEDFLHYRTDTQGGSSGSPVFNQQWDLVALHHAARGNLNEGVRISRIVAFLRRGVDGNESSLGLLAGVLSPPAASPIETAPVAVGATTPTIQDGRAHWTIPLHVSVALGDLPSPAPADPQPTDPQPADPDPTDSPDPVVDDNDPLLGPALDALADADDLEYYNPAADVAAG